MKNKIIVLVILLLSLAIVIFFVAHKNNQNNKENSKDNSGLKTGSQPVSLNDFLKTEFSGFKPKIESQEKYENLDKVVVNFSNGELSPTPGSKAVLFFKDGQFQNIPDDYLKEIAEKYKTNSADEISSIKYYDSFDKLGEKSKYENVYLVTIKLSKPQKSESAMYPEDLKYLLVFLDKYGSKLFSTNSMEIIN